MKNKNTPLVFLFIICATHGFGQSICYNLGFETGSTEGATMYYGKVRNGKLIDKQEDSQMIQHELKWILDSNDEIAQAYCNEHKELPVVGFGMGQFSLKIGDVEGGAYYSKYSREMTISPDNNFLILNYAVVLDDPGHDHLDQPRFELNFKDENGDSFDCGKYEVFAGPNLEGFEACHNYRVRPWTSAGFELNSFLGQTITIEITAVDCSLGGHGGYAYINLECRPLEIVIDNYCPNSVKATLSATEGFEKYLWNTGDTTSHIEVLNPTPGTPYSVEVTSATGCTVTLTDTLPSFETLPLPQLYQENDTTLCRGDYFFYTPAGKNLDRIELVGKGEFEDSLLLISLDTSTYRFVAKDINGCQTDTMSFTVFSKKTPFIENIIFDPNNDCDSTLGGNAYLKLFDNFSNIDMSIDDNSFVPYVDTISNLATGRHVIKTHYSGCMDSVEIDIPYQNPTTIYNTRVIDASCTKNNGYINLETNQNYLVDSVFIDGLFSSTSVYTPVDTGWHEIIIVDNLGCRDTTEAIVGKQKPPRIDSFKVEIDNCFEDSKLAVFATGENYLSYSLDNSWFNYSNTFYNLNNGPHTIIVRQNSDCFDTLDIVLDYEDFVQLSLVSVTNATCGLDNGLATVKVDFGNPGYKYMVDNIGTFPDSIVENLPQGTHSIIVIDDIGCRDTLEFEIHSNSSEEIKVISIDSTTCNEENGKIEVSTESGSGALYFQLDKKNDSLGQFSSLPPGEHIVIVHDTLLCSDTIILNIPSKLPVLIDTVIVSHTTCNLSNGSAQIITSNGFPAYTYYSDIHKQQPIPLLDSFDMGNHRVYVKDGDGCVDSVDVQISAIPPADIHIESQVNSKCDNNAWELGLKIDNLTDPFSVSVDGTDYGSSYYINGITSGMHTLILEDGNGCLDSLDITLDTIYNPELFLEASLNAHCAKDNGQIIVGSHSGIFPHMYSLDNLNFSNDSIFNSMTEGSYMIYVQDSMLCMDSLKVIVERTEKPILDLLDVQDATCNMNNGEIEFAIEGGSEPYSVLLNEGSDTITNNKIDMLPKGYFYLSLQDKDLCTDTVFFKIDSIPKIEYTIDKIIAQTCHKNDGAVLLSIENGVKPYSYFVNSTQINNKEELLQLNTGNYILEILDSLGCRALDSFYIPILEPIALYVEDIKHPNCGKNNGYIRVQHQNGEGAIEYFLENEKIVTPEINSLSEGIYTIEVIDSIGCIDSSKITLERIDFPSFMEINGTASSCEGMDLSVSVDVSPLCEPAYLISNYKDTLTIHKSTSLHINSTNLNLQLFTNCECSIDTSIVFPPVVDLYIPNIFSPNSTTGNERLYISARKTGEFVINKMLIYDSWGNKVYEGIDLIPNSKNQKFWDGSFNGKDAVAGVYAYILEYIDSCEEKKFRSGHVTMVR